VTEILGYTMRCPWYEH